MEDKKLFLSSESEDFCFSQSHLDRYSRQLILKEIGKEGQNRLTKARILVVGAGGIGSSTLMYLASAGIGTIGIVDGDKIELSNLHRQVIHSRDGIGQKKVHSAAEFIKNLNPEAQVICHDIFITPQNVTEIVQDYQIVIDGSDNAICRYVVNDACKKKNICLVSGAAVKWESQITLLCYKDSACYRCLYPECPNSKEVLSCSNNGVIGTVPGLTGVILASQALKVVLGVPDNCLLFKKMLSVNLLSDSYKVYTIKGKNPECIVCRDPDSFSIGDFDYLAFTGQKSKASDWDNQLDVRWEDITSQTLLLDVRPDEHHSINFFERVKHISMEKLSKMDLEEIKSEIPQMSDSSVKLFVFCKAGITSKRAVRHLRAMNINAFSLNDGLQGYQKSKRTTFALL